MKYNKFIYRFLDELNQVIYIGKTINLANRIKSHNHLPKECYANTKKIEFLPLCTKADQDVAEHYYIQKYQPVYNTFQIKRKLTFSIPFLDEQEWFCYWTTEIFTVYNFINNQNETYYRLDSKFFTENEILEHIKNDPTTLFKISKPTKTMILEAEKYNMENISDDYESIKLNLSKNGLLIKNFKYITPELAEIAVKQNGLAIRYIPEGIQTEYICECAIKQNIESFRYTKYKTEEMCWYVIKKQPSFINYVPPYIRTDKMLNWLIDQNPFNIELMSDNIITEKLMWRALKENYEIFYSCNHRTTEMYQYVFEKEKNIERFCMECKYSLYKLPDSIVLECLKYDGLWIRDIDNPSKELCLTAINQNPLSVLLINDISDEILVEVYLKLITSTKTNLEAFVEIVSIGNYHLYERKIKTQFSIIENKLKHDDFFDGRKLYLKKRKILREIEAKYNRIMNYFERSRMQYEY